MSSELFIPLLQQGNTGDEILAILDTLTAPTVPNTVAQEYGTLEDIEFWWVDNIGGQNLMSFVSFWVVTVWYTEGATCPLSDFTLIWVLCYYVKGGVAAPPVLNKYLMSNLQKYIPSLKIFRRKKFPQLCRAHLEVSEELWDPPISWLKGNNCPRIGISGR